jgi:hypothetical protein
MSLSQETLLELMSLADGELEGEARLRAERLVAESDEARRVLDGLRSQQAQQLGTWLSESMDLRATAAGADGIADAVMSRLSAERPAGGVVARIDDARGARSGASGRSARVLVGAALAATALAAGVALLLRPGDQGLLAGRDRMPVASVGMPSVDTEGPPTQAAPGGGVEVDEVDSPSRGISVFEIPLGRSAGASARAGGASASSVVIWIDDEGAK